MTERPRRERKVSDPKMLRARLEADHAAGRPMDIDDDEVTGVIDVATEIARERVDHATSSVREMIHRKFRTPPGGNPSLPVDDPRKVPA